MEAPAELPTMEKIKEEQQENQQQQQEGEPQPEQQQQEQDEQQQQQGGSHNGVENDTQNQTHNEANEEKTQSTESSRVLRLHGLPYSIKEEHIRTFFADFELAEKEPILYFTEGLHRGTGFIRLKRAEDVPLAIQKLHRQHIDPTRYVELAASSEEDRQQTLEQQEQSCKVHVLRLRGLPFTSTEEDVTEFIKSVKGVVRVDICRDLEGRNTGDAFVELASEEDVEQAKQLHNKTMGSRYIEVLSSTVYDRDAIMRAASLRSRRERRGGGGRGGSGGAAAMGAMGPGGGPGGAMGPMGYIDPLLATYMGYFPHLFTPEQQHMHHQQQQFNPHDRMAGGPPAPYPAGAGAQPLFSMFPGQSSLMAPRQPSTHVVRIRGVPYTATEESIAEFFTGVKIPPQGVHMVYNEQNRPTGEAFVELEDEGDVAAALDKNGGAMGNRYIEVFQSSAAAMQRLGSPLTGMMGMMPYPVQGLGMIPQMFY
ncbi:heterogeneous nuclear ribonucleoprotein H/F [Trypanosoma theileri]|uniref:Heterogeneous nuclear ribonucleoprotein H/F n=1 Tax=Trypanosoma theileri TaxID=67003 RepID=A0A1X0NRW6_9TRYP|nr:heterogeneous nuclear ribonucleoprotein H/F [Trypanosoma theileri]ORC87223.1 heterogeneous nuclear ribonucleoprotein H/F [Trypanosoma theileri]